MLATDKMQRDALPPALVVSFLSATHLCPLQHFLACKTQERWRMAEKDAVLQRACTGLIYLESVLDLS